MNKTKLLINLKEEIIDKYGKEKTWFFPEYGGVKGFLGEQDIMFVGLNPSTGNFPSIYDKLFYDRLRENKLENAHITDIVKIRIPNKNVREAIENQEFLNEHLDYLNKEIKIISPKEIIAMGNECHKILKENCNREIIKIYHYHYAKRFNKEKEYALQMKKVKELYLKQ
jgi:hypothetical protein